ncbi:MAG: hypothetical protein ACOC05_04475 [Oceanicaulis sp.]
MDILQQVLDFFQAGFDRVNAVQGLIIALVAALLLPDWRRLPAFTMGAAVVHVLVDTLLPVIASGAALRLPDVLEAWFWRYVVSLLAGYLVVIALLMVVRKLILKR